MNIYIGKSHKLTKLFLMMFMLLMYLNVNFLFGSTIQTVMVKGIVTDPNGARISNAIVVLEGIQAKRETRTNEIGEYEFHMPPGVYRITSIISEYYPFRRASFRLKPSSNLIINITPTIRVLSIGTELSKDGIREPITLAPSPKYQSFLKVNLDDSQLDLLIQFKNKEETKDFIDYINATATFDSIMLQADKIRLTRSSFQLEAERNVKYDDGEHQLTLVKVSLDLKNRKAVLTKAF